ncbi:ribonuclease H-like domain-containing protein [Tanacetum coccineum]
MAREAEAKRVVNTGTGVTKPVWTNANRINHSNNFVPRSVQLNTCRPKVNSVSPKVNTVSPKVNSVSPKVNTVRPRQTVTNKTSNSLSPKRPQMDQFNQRRDFSNSYSSVRRPFAKSTAQMAHANAVMGSWGYAVKTSASYISSGRPKVNSGRPKVNSDRPKVNTVSPKINSVSTTSNSMSPKRPQMDQINQRRDFSKSYSSVRRPFAKSTAQMAHTNAVMGSWGSAEHPLKNMVDRGIFDSGCSGHMTGNKDQLEDFEEFNGGSVTFGGSKGYISGKGRIRVGNLDFNSVSFVKELGHFNLFSISQICDKQHKVLFTETECLVVSSDFKMPDENQILLKVPRHHNMYSFDMKTPSPAKGFACLIAKATSDESKLWHRRLGHINFKNLNKLVKGNLVRGLPSKLYFLNLWRNKANNSRYFKGTNSAVTSQTPVPLLLRKRMRKDRAIVVPSAVKIPEDKDSLTEPQKEIKDSSNNPKIQGFRRELEEIALKHLGNVPENNTTSTHSVNTCIKSVILLGYDHDDSLMLELEIFHKLKTGIFDEASYDEEGVITDFNSLPTEIEVNPTPTLRIHLFTSTKKSNTCARIDAIRLFLAFAHYGVHTITKMDVKSAFSVCALEEKEGLCGTHNLLVLFDPDHPNKRSMDTRGAQLTRLCSLKEDKQDIMASSRSTSPSKQGGIFISQDKYVAEILKKFDLVNVKAAITPMETKLPLTKMRMLFEVTPKIFSSQMLSKIFQVSQGSPNLGHMVSMGKKKKTPFDLEAFSDSDYGGSNLDRKSTTGGCQFLRQRLISWQFKKVKKVGRVYEKEEFGFCQISEEEEPELRGGKDTSDRNKSQILLKKPNSPKGIALFKVKVLLTKEGDHKKEKRTKEMKSPLLLKIRTKEKGKAPISSEETPKKSKEQIYKRKLALLKQLEEEELTEQQKKRKAQVQFEAQHYTNEDWDLIRAKIEANAELSKSMLGSELQGEDFAKKMVDLNQGTWKLSQLKKLSFEEVKEEFDKLVKQVESFAPISFEATKASLKRFGEELQTKTPKRQKDDKDVEAKDDEPTKKSGKRRKQMARKGLHTSVDKNDSEDSDEVVEQRRISPVNKNSN